MARSSGAASKNGSTSNWLSPSSETNVLPARLGQSLQPRASGIAGEICADEPHAHAESGRARSGMTRACIFRQAWRRTAFVSTSQHSPASPVVHCQTEFIIRAEGSWIVP
jgi:hypothetical protein